MKNEHELLHEVIEKIGYESKFKFEDETFVEYIPYSDLRIVDVREIIFSQDFMDAYRKYYTENIVEESYMVGDMYFQLLQNNLNNPSLYLHNLLFKK